MKYRNDLTAEYVRLLISYDPNTGIFIRKQTGRIINNKKHGYIVIKFKHTWYAAGRIAWLYQTGSWPKNEIDHINKIKDDNRWCNLRDVTKQENLKNKGPYKKRKFLRATF